LEIREQIKVAAFAWASISLFALILVLPAFRITVNTYLEKTPSISSSDCPIELNISALSLYLNSAFGAVEAALIYVMPAYLFREMCTKF
jgi:hypothetical protein